MVQVCGLAVGQGWGRYGMWACKKAAARAGAARVRFEQAWD